MKLCEQSSSMTFHDSTTGVSAIIDGNGLRIMGSDGVMLSELVARADSKSSSFGVSLSLCASGARPMIGMAVASDGSALTYVNGDDGTRLVALGRPKNEQALFTLARTDGQKVIHARIGPDGSGLIAAGKSQTGPKAMLVGGGICCTNKDEKVVVAISASEFDGGAISVSNKNAKRVVTIEDLESGGGVIQLRNVEGADRVSVSGLRDSGDVSIKRDKEPDMHFPP
ncbi:MAG: hypothetical protein JSS27_11850 [Planctomycetes bacterium]|nr:hypothetical protein [Planctomycetota bacterium]